MSYKKIIKQVITNFEVQEFIAANVPKAGYSSSKYMMTPLGERIVIYTSKPGLIVGSGGLQIRKLTKILKKRFNFENPQIEIQEVEEPMLDANILANRIAQSLEKYGIARFKAIGHKAIEDVMRAGARGVEVIIAGKVPSSRAKRWRFYTGYMKKCGDIAISGVRTAYATAFLKIGAVGIKVRIMPPDIKLPDDITVSQKEAMEIKVTEDNTENNIENADEKAKDDAVSAGSNLAEGESSEKPETENSETESRGTGKTETEKKE